MIQGKILLLGLATLVVLVSAKCGNYNQNCGGCAAATSGFSKCVYCVGSGLCTDSDQADCDNVNIITHAFDCPRSPPNDWNYSDDFGRKKVLPLVCATNNDGAGIQTCLDNNFQDTKLIKQYTVKCDKDGDTCSAYLAVNKADKSIIVAYRGSKGMMQLAVEGGDFLFNVVKAFPPTGGNVDKYFYDAYYDILNLGLQSDLQLQIVANPTFELWTVGHSLGGSMAAMAAAHFVKLNYFKTEKVKLFTVGEPRTGDISFAEGHDALVKYTYRIVNHRDIIVNMPARVYDDLFDSPFHHRFEIWYPHGMAVGQGFQVCTRADDGACSNSINHDSTDDHTHYFNVDMAAYSKNGCK
uniref:Lipase_3 domain-containing protein n=1 Tax=Rhabditophanes sp. KR3021 TaxID=114890 RepID=A0AC35TNT1_9BILA